MEPGLEPFGKTAEVEIQGAEERMAWLHPVEVGEEHALCALGAAVDFVHHFERPRPEERSMGE